MAHVHLVLGPVGAGKSTFGRRLAAEHTAVRLTVDDWMPVLFSPDRPDSDVMSWYTERVERVVEQIWRVALGVLAVERDVVLELGLIRRDQRAAFFWRVGSDAPPMTIYQLDAPREVRRARILKRNDERGETWAMDVPPEIFELASDLWQPLTPAEREGRDVRDVATA